MVFVCMSSAGLPGLNGFVSEFLIFLGSFAHRPLLAVLASSGVVLGAWYLLRLLYRVFFGPLKEPVHEGHEPITDLNGREIVALAPILILCIVIGVYPQFIIGSIERDIGVVVRITADAKVRAAQTAVAEADSALPRALAATSAKEEMQ
jgi:NADH-quinone oxidoreductase subunit M